MRGGVGGGEEEFHAAPAEPLPQQGTEAGVLPQQGDAGGDRLGGAGQAQRPAREGTGRAGGVQGQRGGGDAHVAGVAGVRGPVVLLGARVLGQAEAGGEGDGVLAHAVAGRVRHGGHHEAGQSLVPVRGEHVRVREQFGGGLAGERGDTAVRMAQGQVDAVSGPPVPVPAEGVAGDVAQAAGGVVDGRHALCGAACGAGGGARDGTGERGDVEACEHLRVPCSWLSGWAGRRAAGRDRRTGRGGRWPRRPA